MPYNKNYYKKVYYKKMPYKKIYYKIIIKNSVIQKYWSVNLSRLDQDPLIYFLSKN